MPSPVGHVLGGLIVALAFADKHERHEEQEGRRFDDLRGLRGVVTLCVVAACLPDIDFGWGRHNMETHSIGFALLLGAVVMAWKRAPHLALASTLAVGTHVLFDWLGSDDFPPLGVMALWPFTSEFYFADAYVFATISRRYWLADFFEHNVRAVLREVAILGPIALALFILQRKRRRVRNRARSSEGQGEILHGD